MTKRAKERYVSIITHFFSDQLSIAIVLFPSNEVFHPFSSHFSGQIQQCNIQVLDNLFICRFRKQYPSRVQGRIEGRNAGIFSFQSINDFYGLLPVNYLSLIIVADDLLDFSNLTRIVCQTARLIRYVKCSHSISPIIHYFHQIIAIIVHAKERHIILRVYETAQNTAKIFWTAFSYSSTSFAGNAASDQYSFAPAGIWGSTISRCSFSSPFSWWTAEISMPQESMPIIALGGRLVMAMQVLPTSSSGS